MRKDKSIRARAAICVLALASAALLWAASLPAQEPVSRQPTQRQEPQEIPADKPPVSSERVTPDSSVVVPVRPGPGPVEPPPSQDPVAARFTYRHEALSARTRRLRGVLFEDHSTGNVAGRRWSFGDGSEVDNIPNPVHAYPEEGFYRPCLTVVGPGDPRISAPPRSSTCQVLYTDVIAQLLKSFLGPVEQRLGLSSRRAGQIFNRLVRTPPFDRLSRAEREALRQLVGDPATRAAEIIAFLVRVTYEHYKPYIYVFASVGADVCDLVGHPECRVEAGVAGYAYLDLIDTTQFILRQTLGLVSSDPFSNRDQTRRDNFITVVVNAGVGIGVGPGAGVGILLVPRPRNAALDEDFDFNSFDPSCRNEPINCALRNANAAVSVGGTFLGFTASRDGSLGFESTVVGYGASTQIVRLDVDGDAMLTDATSAMRCALDIYNRAGGLSGAHIDYARAFSEAFQPDLLASPPSFRINCGNVRCRGVHCAGTVSSLRGFRDVSWGPPVLVVRTIARLLPVEISSLSFGRSGRVRVDGEAGGLLDFSVDFEPRAGVELTLGHENLVVNVRNYETIDPLGARISGNVRLYGMDLGDSSIAVHTWQSDADWRLYFEQKLFGFVDLVYSLQSPRAESLSLEVGSLSMKAADVIDAGRSAVTFRGNVFWGSANLGTADVVVARDRASVRIGATQPAMARSWPGGPVRLRGSVRVSGDVTIVHRSNGAESATFDGSARATSEIRVTAADLGVDEFDFTHSFDSTYDNIRVAVDSQGNARLPYHYPRLRLVSRTLPYPCPSTCTGRIPGTDRTVTVPCPDICTKDVDVPIGVDTVTGELVVSFW